MRHFGISSGLWTAGRVGSFSRAAGRLRYDIRIVLGLARGVRPRLYDRGRPVGPLADQHVEVSEETANELKLGQPPRKRTGSSRVLLADCQAFGAAGTRPRVGSRQRRQQVSLGPVLGEEDLEKLLEFQRRAAAWLMQPFAERLSTLLGDRVDSPRPSP